MSGGTTLSQPASEGGEPHSDSASAPPPLPGTVVHRTDRWTARDAVALASVAVVAAVIASVGASRIDATAFEFRQFDVYLQGDLPRTYEQMVTRFHNGGRSGVHPLYALFVYPVTTVIRLGLGLSPLHAVHVVVGLFAAAWSSLVFVFGRAMGLGRVDSLLATGVALAGASAAFWLVVPETFLLGGIAILATAAAAALAIRRPLSDSWYVAAGVATLGTTLTNWSTGVLFAATTRSWRRFVSLCLQVLGATTLLWIVEKLLVPGSVFIFDQHGVRQYIRVPDLARIVEVTRAFFVHAAVAPRLEACRNLEAGLSPQLLSFQGAAIGSGGGLGVTATVFWLLLLVLVAVALAKGTWPRGIAIVLGGSLLFQFGLQVLYGGETFLYSMHWWGILVALVVLALHHWRGRGMRLVAVAFILTAGLHNRMTWEASLPAFTDMSRYPGNARSCEP